MGISYSCPGADYDSLEDDFEAVIVRSISFKGDDVKTAFRSVSFNGRDSEPTILKSIGSGKMIIEGSVRFKRNDTFHLGTTISIKAAPCLEKMENALRTVSFKDTEIGDSLLRSNSLTERTPESPVLETGSPKYEAAVKLQKVYKSFRTRRKLADCAVLVEQRWWKLLDFAVLKQSSVSFFDIGKPESAVSRWMRARTRAAKVGKGLSKDEKARKLALQHWLEAIDPRHRYGHNLHFYYDCWLHCESKQPFFYWLDVGEGKEVNLERCLRPKLQQQCIKYLGPREREDYEVIVEDGKFLYKQSRMLLDTSEGPKDSKWIFVLSTSKTLYVGQKMKGKFQHSSFLAGGATSAAGRLVVEDGILKAVWPHSGHYRPTEENFQEFVTFLTENNVDLTDVKKSSTDEEEIGSKLGSCIRTRSNSGLNLSRRLSEMETEKITVEREPESNQSNALENEIISDVTIPKESDCFLISETAGQFMGLSCGSFSTESQSVQDENPEESSTSEKEYMFHKSNLFEEDQEEEGEAIVPKESILRRINSKKGMKSYQLGKQLSFKWTTGAGPRIACVRDYPSELQARALEQVNLSPRSTGNSRPYASPRNLASPKLLSPSLLGEDSIKNSNHCN